MPADTHKMRNPIAGLFTATALAAALVACDPGIEDSGGGEGENGNGTGGGGSGSGSSAYYSGPGPAWDLTINNSGRFDWNVRRQPGGGPTNNINGRFTELSSGFSRFTVSSATGDGRPTADTQLSALAIEDEILFVQDWQNNGRLVPMVPGDECPERRVRGNWIQWLTPSSAHANEEEQDFFGVLYMNANSAEIDLDPRYALTEDFPEQDEADIRATGECEDGVAQEGDSRTFFGSNGVVLSHENVGQTDERMRLGLPSSSLSAADLDGEYIGIWIDNRRTGTNRTWYVTASCSDNGNCEVQRISDVASLNSITNETVRLELDNESFDEPQQGIATGVVEEVDQQTMIPHSGRIACIASEDFNRTGDKVLACVGQSPLNNQLTVNGFFVAED